MKIHEVVDYGGITLYAFVSKELAERKAEEMMREFEEEFFVTTMELTE